MNSPVGVFGVLLFHVAVSPITIAAGSGNGSFVGMRPLPALQLLLLSLLLVAKIIFRL